MSKPTGNVVVVVVVRVCVRERVVLNVPESSLSPSLSLVQLWGFLGLLMLMMLLLKLLLAPNQSDWHLLKKHKSPCFETEPVSHNATQTPPSPSSSSRLLANDS
jgi:hypothetical protein